VNKNSQRFVSLLVLAFMAQWLMGCTFLSATTPEFSPTPGMIIASPNPAYALAQATIDSGQNQLSDLSRRATQVSLNMSQAAKDAAQSTQDANQRQKADLDYQSTIVSLNIAQAVATQKFLTRQTNIANDATTAALSSAATAAQSAYLANVNQTAQAQASLDAQALQTAQVAATLTAYPLTETFQAQVILNAQATQTAQAIANLTAHPLTATPFAETQAALLMQQYGREQQSFMDQVVTPLMPYIVTFFLLLLILGIILAYRRFMPKPWPRILNIPRVIGKPSPLIMIDAVAADLGPRLQRIIPFRLTPANPPQPPGDNKVHVEIVNAKDPPFAHWIAEVERQLADEGGQSL
jgi:hypothetical protein